MCPVGNRAKNALVGEMVRWNLYPFRNVFELQELSEGCWEIVAKDVPLNKNAVGWPPTGDLVEPRLAAKILELPVIEVVRVVAKGGPASSCREPGKPDGWRLVVSSSWGHQLEK